jgi:hypothetical protein
MLIAFFWFHYEFLFLYFLLLWSLFSFRLELMVEGKIRDENMNRRQRSNPKISKECI